jgi:hypothetical protein
VTQSVYEGHFDEPKTQRSRRSAPLGAMSIEILSARKSAGVNPGALVFSTEKGTSFDRHNLVAAQAHVQKAGTDGSRLALVAARACHPAGCGGHTTGYGTGASRPLVFRNNPRGLPAFDPRGCAGSRAKGRGFAHPTQVDPNCRNRKNGKLANSMMGLGKLVGERGFEPPTPWSRNKGCQLDGHLSGPGSLAGHSRRFTYLFSKCSPR